MVVLPEVKRQQYKDLIVEDSTLPILIPVDDSCQDVQAVGGSFAVRGRSLGCVSEAATICSLHNAARKAHSLGLGCGAIVWFVGRRRIARKCLYGTTYFALGVYLSLLPSKYLVALAAKLHFILSFSVYL